MLPAFQKLHNLRQHVFVAFLTEREGAPGPGCVAGADGMHHICHSTKPYQPKSISKSVEVNFQNQSKTLNQTISTKVNFKISWNLFQYQPKPLNQTISAEPETNFKINLSLPQIVFLKQTFCFVIFQPDRFSQFFYDFPISKMLI